MPLHLNPSQNQSACQKDDLQYLIGLLDKAEEEIETEGEGYRQNKGSTLSTRRRIIRIKSALINFEGNRNSEP